MFRILVIEDEQAMLMGLKDNLEIEGYQVDTASDGAKGLDMILKNEHSLILLDVMLPTMSGFDVCHNARSKGITTPIVLLTAKGEEIDKVLGLELGADDYMTKPFSLRELLARIKALLRRLDHASHKPEHKLFAAGKMTVNFDTYEAFVDGQPVKMSHKEFEFLHYLLDNPNKVISRDELLDNVWGTDYMPSARTVDNFVLKLRQLIEQDSNKPKIILTVHGVGYKFIG
ncbi:MAG: response regulator transcription factor [Bacteroidales bacterium]|nr:response regulator transcription factor [Bacteroidales bacterium]